MRCLTSQRRQQAVDRLWRGAIELPPLSLTATATLPPCLSPTAGPTPNSSAMEGPSASEQAAPVTIDALPNALLGRIFSLTEKPTKCAPAGSVLFSAPAGVPA